MAPRRVSILIPTHNPGRRIQDVLRSIFAQDAEFDFEIVVVDSTSRAEDVEFIRSFPIRFEQIARHEFGHGRTRNLLARLALGDVLVYLSQDAEPAGSTWLRALLEPLADPSVAGVYARQIPSLGADPLIRFFLTHTYGPQPARRHLTRNDTIGIDDIFFSNVSSAIRKDVWQRFPFRENVVMSEDQYWAHDVLRGGYDVVYQPEACVYHSHNYSLRTLFRRNWLSGASLRGLIADRPGAIAQRGLEYTASQARYLVRSGRAQWLPYMFLYEITKAVGFGMGIRFGRQRA
ncbi:MAG: glycosyltransferase family 2 protein [Chloroflexi bacterium]|nr:glycosyltransferase family 2 protein [Chloroflexota bacterium]MBV9893479.1 glycosyltransferase family 2 protein [Chloroflexota bacterium]